MYAFCFQNTGRKYEANLALNDLTRILRHLGKGLYLIHKPIYSKYGSTEKDFFETGFVLELKTGEPVSVMDNLICSMSFLHSKLS